MKKLTTLIKNKETISNFIGIMFFVSITLFVAILIVTTNL